MARRWQGEIEQTLKKRRIYSKHPLASDRLPPIATCTHAQLQKPHERKTPTVDHSGAPSVFTSSSFYEDHRSKNVDTKISSNHGKLTKNGLLPTFTRSGCHMFQGWPPFASASACELVPCQAELVVTRLSSLFI